MIGLAGIGAALLLGVGMRIAAASGALLLVLMWTAVLPPENNPFMDDHLIYAILLVGLALVKAGDTLGLGRWWSETRLAKRCAILKQPNGTRSRNDEGRPPGAPPSRVRTASPATHAHRRHTLTERHGCRSAERQDPHDHAGGAAAW